MGDSSELRPLVFVGTFISIMVILFSLTPTQFFIADPSSRQVFVPATWEGFLLTSSGNYSKTWNSHIDHGTFTSGLYHQEVDDGSGTFGGWEIRVGSNGFSILSFLTVYKQNFWWIIPTGIEPLRFRASNGKDYGDSLDRLEINEVYTQTGKLDFSVSLSYLSFDFLMSYNTTKYAMPADAWWSDELLVFCGMGYDQTQQNIDTWGFIRQILFFQMPNIHPVLNLIIAVPLWIGIAYVSYILLLKAIGIIFGGGA